MDVQGVGVVHAVNEDLIVGGIALVQQDGLDLRGEHVDAADDEHVVGASHRLGHLEEGNHSNQMKETRRKVEEFLISK